MKQETLEIIACPVCLSSLTLPCDPQGIHCENCKAFYPIRWNQLIMTPTPENIIPAKNPRRPPRSGTVWRVHNWDFLASCEEALPGGALVIDIGAGPGDFAPLFRRHRYIATDFYPYEGLDLVCDLRKAWPFRPSSTDVIVCTNVLEHIYDGIGFVRRLAETLRPGGQLWIAVPFMIKIHQAPYDFHRYTHFALEELVREADLKIHRMEGVYLPDYLLGSALNNLRESIKPNGRLTHAIARRVFNATAWLMPRIVSRLLNSETKGAKTSLSTNPYPMGYHISCTKPA